MVVVISIALICVTVLIVFAGTIAAIKEAKKSEQAYYVAVVDTIAKVSETVLDKYDYEMSVKPKTEQKD